MRSLETERLLARTLCEVADAEQRVEAKRVTLSQRRDFVPYAAFKHLDRYDLGRIDSLDFTRFYQTAGIVSGDVETRAIVQQYDGNEDGRLSEEEFSQLVLPATDEFLRRVVQDRVRPSLLSPECLQILRELLETELAFHQRVERAKTDLITRADFHALDAFKCIDSASLGYIDRSSLKWFLRKHGFDITETDIDAIFRRWDTDDDERLVYREFADALAPIRPVTTLRQSTELSTSSIHSSTRQTAPQEPEEKRSTSKPNTEEPIKTGEDLTVDELRTEPKTVEPPPEEEEAKQTRNGNKSESTRSPYWPPPNQLTEAEKEALLDTFHEQVVNSRELELLRQETALAPDFTVEDAFLFLDLQDSGSLSPRDLEAALQEHGIRVFGDDAELLVRRYSDSPRLSLQGFAAMVEPVGESYRRLLAAHVSQRLKGDDRKYVFRTATKAKLLDLFRLLLHIEHRNEVRRQGYQKLQEFRPQTLFALLDSTDHGNVTVNEVRSTQLRKFLSEYGVYASEREVSMLLEIYDSDHDGKISEQEFVEEVTPHSRKEYL